MSENITSINDFETALICEYYSSTERQGPGSPEITLKALSFVEGLTEKSIIADIGCGTGGQTMILASHTQGQITGLDLFPNFIDIFNANAKKFGFHDRVKGIVQSMDKLSFCLESLDLIWSEGAIYNIGFERGLNEWKGFLKTGGYIAVTEASWFTDQRPQEIEEFWLDAYPGIDTIPNKLAQMQKVGYVPIASFILPDYCWTKNFFEPQNEAQGIFLNKYTGNKFAKDLVDNQNYERVLYDKYKDYYGYVFYIGKKI